MPGPFFFAWVDEAEEWDAVAHAREDEKVFSFEIEHIEGELPTLNIVIRNPKVGLLAPGRKVWAWFSVSYAGEVVPLYFGRLIGIPTDILAEACTLLFIAKPVDFIDQKIALAETMKVRPWYDPIWIDEQSRDDPDTVLEGYSKLWHVDRVTHEVTVSDVLSGEDGQLDFGEADAFYDNVRLTLNQPPLVRINVEGMVQWTQKATGVVDIGGRSFRTHSAGIFNGWPEAGADIGAGWKVEAAAVTDLGTSAPMQVTGNVNYSNTESIHHDGDTMSASMSWSYPTGYHLGAEVPGSKRYVNYIRQVNGMLDSLADPPVNRPASLSEAYTYLFMVTTNATQLSLRYNAERDRTEKLTFTATSDLQNIITLPDSNTPDFETISLTASGDLPIADPAGRSYFPTDRGLWSLEYLICLARAHLAARARAVEIAFECQFERAIELSCRKNARLTDRRLPGGSAIGKIISYAITGDGDNGELLGRITIACAVGYGGLVPNDPGMPTYVDLGYVETGYQYFAGSTVTIETSDIGYSVPLDAPSDDGLVFPLDYNQVVVRNELVTTGELEVKAVPTKEGIYITGWQYEFGPSPDHYELELRPVVNGPFDTGFAIDVTMLQIPKMIDLEAASAQS